MNTYHLTFTFPFYFACFLLICPLSVHQDIAYFEAFQSKFLTIGIVVLTPSVPLPPCDLPSPLLGSLVLFSSSSWLLPQLNQLKHCVLSWLGLDHCLSSQMGSSLYSEASTITTLNSIIFVSLMAGTVPSTY